jgi:hypothetical protein
MKVIISVTREDIEVSFHEEFAIMQKYGHCRTYESFCPVAVAAKRVPIITAELGYVEVHTMGVYTDKIIWWDWRIHGLLSIELPRNVLDKILRYDRTRKMRPFTFSIDLRPNEFAQRRIQQKTN